MPCGWDSIDGFIFNTVYLLAEKDCTVIFSSITLYPTEEDDRYTQKTL